MAESEKINFDDIVEVGNAIKNLDKMISRVKKLEIGFIEALKSHEQYLKSVSKKDITAENYDEINEKISESIKVRAALAETQKKETELLKQKKQLEQEEVKLRLLNAKATKEQAKETESLNKKNKDANSIYTQTQKRLSEIRKEQRDLQVSQKLGNKLTAEQTKRLEELTNEAGRLNEALKQTDETTGLYVRNVGNYTDSINQAISSNSTLSKIQGDVSQALDIAKNSFGGLTAQASQYAKGLINAAGAAGKFSNGIKLIGATAKSSGILLVLSALASAGAFFTKFSQGQESLRVFTAQAKAMADVLVNRLAAAFPILINLASDFFAFIKAAAIPFRIQFESMRLVLYKLLDVLGGDYSEAIQESIQNIKDYKKDLEALGETNILDNLSKLKNEFSGTSDAMSEAARKAKELELKLIELEKSAIGTRKEIAELARQEEDYSEISADGTKSLKTRQNALDSLFKTQEERLKKINELNTKELDNEREKISLTTGLTVETIKDLEKRNKTQDAFGVEELKRLAELVEATKDSQDAIDDLSRQRFTRIAETNLKFQINELDSIKRRAEFEKKIDEDLIKDNKASYDERLVALKEYQADSESAIKNSLSVITQEAKEVDNKYVEGLSLDKLGIGIKQIDEIATEVNDNVINGRIRELDLAEKMEDQFRKLIEQRREELIKVQEYEELIKKEEIARQQDIAKRDRAAGRRIAAENRKEDIENAEKAQAEDIETQKANLETIRKLKSEDLEIQRQIEVSNKELTEAEIQEIEDKYRRLKNKADEDYNKKISELDKEQEKKQKEARDKSLDETKNAIKEITDATQDELDKRFDLENRANERDIQARQENIDRQRGLAEKGLTNQLAFEEQKKAEAELKARQEEQRQARIKEAIQLSEAFLQAYIAELKQPNATATNASSKAFVSTFLAKGVAKAISGAFYEGTEHVGDSNTFRYKSSGKDSYIAALDQGERVVNARDNKLIPYEMKNHDLAVLAHNYSKGLLQPVYTNSSALDITPLISEFKNLSNSIKSSGLDIRFDANGYYASKKINGNRITTRHKGL